MDGLEKANILLVDDQRENLLALEAVLEDLGQNLVRATSGQEALRKLLAQDFALILMDVQMPELDGFETARLVRESRRHGQTPILFLTAINKSDEHVARGYALGAVDYLFKPYAPDVLRAKVTALVELWRKTRALEVEVAHRRRAEAEVRSLNLELERRVQERTAALRSANRELAAEVAERTRAEEVLRRRAQHARLVADISNTLAMVDERREALEQTCRALVIHMGAAFARIWTLDPTGTELHLQASAGMYTHIDGAHARMRVGELKIGRIAERKEAYLTNDVANDPWTVDRKWAAREGMVSFAGFPLLLEGRVIGVMAMFARHALPDEALKELGAVSEMIGQYIERKRAEEDRTQLLEALEKSEQRYRFLADVSASLSETLDLEATLDRLAEVVVPRFADWCSVDLLQEDGTLRRTALAHSPEKEAAARALSGGYPPDPGGPSLVWDVIRTGEPRLLGRVTEGWVAALARDKEHHRLLRELGAVSCVAVPLEIRGRTLGAISLITCQPQRAYGPEDLETACDVARRAGTAIENARLFREVQEADRAKNNFLAMLGHELRNPLAPIRNSVEALQTRSADNPTVARSATIIARQIRHLTRLVDDMLDVSRIIRGRIDLRREEADLVALLRQAIETSRADVAARRHTLSVTVPDEPVYASVDPVRLEQVVTNLLNNAAKYTEPGGDIAVTLQREGGAAAIRVRDNGIGISREMLPRVFEVFAQAERTLDRSQGGLGLGLALVKNLVEMHGGAVEARSEGPGQGSEFIIRLPALPRSSGGAAWGSAHRRRNGAAAPNGVVRREPGAPDPGPARATAPPHRRGGPRRVLVVDDNLDAAETLVELLELWGYEVSVAHDGPGAVRVASERHPEVVLLDIGLPGYDGMEVARRLRADPTMRRATIVAITGYGQQRDEAMEEGTLDYYLTKPVDPGHLRHILAEEPAAALAPGV